MKDYYSILGIPFAEKDINVVRNAYKSLCADLHPDKYKGEDCQQRTEEVNEAYLVLNDESLKDKYDEYMITSESGDLADEASDLFASISLKQEEAKKFTSNFFEQYNKHKTKKSNSKWLSGCGIVFLIFMILGQIGRVISKANYEAQYNNNSIETQYDNPAIPDYQESEDYSINESESIFPTTEEIAAINSQLPYEVAENTMWVRVEYNERDKIQKFYYDFTVPVDRQLITPELMRELKQEMVSALNYNNNKRLQAGMTYIYIYRSVNKEKLYEIKIDKSDL